MKKIFTLILFSNLFLSLNAQLTYEKTYYFSANITEISNGVYKIYEMDDVNNKCILYNLDHSVWKTINLSVPSGQYLYDIQYVTQDVFNLDANIELLYIYRQYVATTSSYYYNYTTRVVNETGTVLSEITNGYVANIVKTSANTSKLIVWTSDFSTFPYVVTSVFYGIPGNLSSTFNSIFTKFSNRPYPNPANSEIFLTYSLPDNTTKADLIIVDVHGKNVKTIKNINTEENFRLDVSLFENGIYFYYIQASGKQYGSYKFVVSR